MHHLSLTPKPPTPDTTGADATSTSNQPQQTQSFLKGQAAQGRELVSSVMERFTPVLAEFTFAGIGLAATGAVKMTTGLVAAAAITYQVLRNPKEVAATVKNACVGAASHIDNAARKSVEALETRFEDNRAKHIAQRIGKLDCLAHDQKSKLFGSLSSAFAGLHEAHTKAIEKSSLFTLPFKAASQAVGSFLAARSFARMVNAVESLHKFNEKYGKLFPEGCKAAAGNLVSAMEDGKMTLAESLTLKMKLFAAGVKNSLAARLITNPSVAPKKAKEPTQPTAEAAETN